MLEELTTFPLLAGFRGNPQVDVAAAVDLIARLASLADTHPALAEIECNPVTVTTDGAFVVDAKAKIAVPAPALPVGANAHLRLSRTACPLWERLRRLSHPPQRSEVCASRRTSPEPQSRRHPQAHSQRARAKSWSEDMSPTCR